MMAYMPTPKLICLRLFKQVVRFAFALALETAGSNKVARMAMTAITTSSSIRVKPLIAGEFRRMPFGQRQRVLLTSPRHFAQIRPEHFRRSGILAEGIESKKRDKTDAAEQKK